MATLRLEAGTGKRSVLVQKAQSCGSSESNTRPEKEMRCLQTRGALGSKAGLRLAGAAVESRWPVSWGCGLRTRPPSWLRINASGMPNTCKSNEVAIPSGERVSNTYPTYLLVGDN